MRILALTQRVPHRPNRGDRIRAHHLLRLLSDEHEIHLAALDDDGGRDAPWPELDEFCARRAVFPMGRARRLLEAGVSFARSEPLSLAWFRHRALFTTLRRWQAEAPFDACYVFSSSMAPYWLDLRARGGPPAVVDFVDVDSLKWGQYAERSAGVKAWIYRREQRLLAGWEAQLAESAHRSLFVHQAEVDAFAAIAPGAEAQALTNGVDLHAFARPDAHREEESERLVFVGMMDYHANVDAVLWFVQEVWPRLREERPGLGFEVVGANPTAELRALDGRDGIRITGRVEDVPPHLWAARVAVVPLRIAQGTQNKVLEAMAASIPVVASSQATRGIGQPRGPHVSVADEAPEFAQAVLALLRDPAAARHQVEAAHLMLREHHSWEASAARLSEYLEAAAESEPR